MQKTENEVKSKVKKTKVSEYGIVNCEKLNLRLGSSLYSDIITVLSKNTEVEILSKLTKVEPNFYKVKVGKTEGYCVCEYLDVHKKVEEMDDCNE